MSKKRGLSLDEKRQRMMDFFYEKKEFYTLKELERLCSKEKCIPSMTVKDVLMSLVYDGMVDTDKIGTSVYFWAFPSKASKKRSHKIDELKAEINKQTRRLSELQGELSSSKAGKEETVERSSALALLASNDAKLRRLSAELAALKKYHPDRLKEVKNQIEIAIDGANRWTDNVFQAKSWLREKYGVDEVILSKQFNIPEDLDYFEV